MDTTSTTPGAGCPETALLCVNETRYCFHGGTCCHVRDMSNHMFCACMAGYRGNMCEEKMLDIEEALESRDSAMRMIGLSTGISVVVGIIALIALITITLIIVRSSRRRRHHWHSVCLITEEGKSNLDHEIDYIQEEIRKLPTVQQLSKLQRLSKLFERTVRDAILSDTEDQFPRPKSVAMNDYLPRWSSAPSVFNRQSTDADLIDSPDGTGDVFQKTKLQQVFSLQ